MDGDLNCAQAADLLGVYALDAVDPEEATLVRSHLTGCQRCADEVAAFQDTAWRLGNSGGEAPVELWDRIAAGIGESQTPRTGPAALPPDAILTPIGHTMRSRRWQAMALGATLTGAAAAAVVIAFLGFRVADLDSQVSRQQAASQSPAAAAAAAAANPETRSFALVSGTDGRSVGEVLLLPSGTAFLTGASLERLPMKDTYQLWFVTHGHAPVSVALLGPDPKTVAFQLSPPTSGSELLVTAEPSPGVEAPTTAPLARSVL